MKKELSDYEVFGDIETGPEEEEDYADFINDELADDGEFFGEMR